MVVKTLSETEIIARCPRADVCRQFSDVRQPQMGNVQVPHTTGELLKWGEEPLAPPGGFYP